MDYHLTWYKCCPLWDDVQWPWPGSRPQRSEYTCSCSRYNLMDYHLSWYKCAYIQEYLGYRSNNLYFLFSHSWPVVVYNFGQLQRTSQVERKTKCSNKTTVGDIAVLWTALFIINIIERTIFGNPIFLWNYNVFYKPFGDSHLIKNNHFPSKFVNSIFETKLHHHSHTLLYLSFCW